jgi:hypothetical protein
MSEIVMKAGTRGDGQSVYERLPAEQLGDNVYRLLRSPAFAPGIARGDTVRLHDDGTCEVIEHSGLLVIRLFARAGISAMAATLGPALNSFDGEIEHEDGRMLVFSVPVGAGFGAIEAVMTQLLEGRNDAAWRYGNVYDDTGEPLNWWQPKQR